MQHIGHLIHAYGLLVVGGFIGLESFGIPLPGETALIVGSAIAGSTHELKIVEVILTAAAASFLGRLIGYAIGAQFGYWLLLRYGAYVRITEGRIKLGQYLFLRHGEKIMIVAQFIPVLRAIAGLLAGANRMPWRPYLIATALGALIWAAFFGLLAFWFGRQFARLADSWEWWLAICIGAVVVLSALAVFVNRHEAQLIAEAERALPGPLTY